jgi:small subunit ribosomal protein S1
MKKKIIVKTKKNSFQDLLDKHYEKMDSLEPGEKINTKIISITDEYIFLELNGKSEGILEIDELKDEEGNCSVKEGDSIDVFFLESKNGEKIFTTRIKAEKAGKDELQKAYKNAIPVEGVVEKEIKGGFEIKLGNSRAFCPYSQIGLRRVDNPEELIGTKHTFKILEYSEGGRNIMVSSRVILEENKQKDVETLKKTLKVGMTVYGTVKSIQSFGAFVDIGGIEALLPVSEIQLSRVDDINNVLKAGQNIEASILSLDWKNEKFSISIKELLDNPWKNIHIKYPEGSKHDGTVQKITDFGAFVSLEPGIEGLIHKSEIRMDTPNTRPVDIFKKGDTIRVEINSIDSDKKRLSLKHLSSLEDEESLKSYMDDSEEETFNPFAAFMKDKK